MANPNIVAVTSILGVTTYLTPSGTSAVVLLPNAASSGKVFKINQIVAANVDGSSAVDTTVSLYTNGAVAQGSAPSGGTAFPIVSTISVPADCCGQDYGHLLDGRYVYLGNKRHGKQDYLQHKL
mgnify:CR=1 FL=1